MQKLGPQTVVNRVVFMLHELPKQVMGHLPGDLAGVHLDGGLHGRALGGMLGLGSPREANKSYQDDGEQSDTRLSPRNF
jgi:hypothetical protein